MAKLVGVCRTDDYELQRRQFPLSMDDTLALIVQFPDTCTSCHGDTVDQQEVNNFTKKFKSLSAEEISRAAVLNKNVVINQLSHNVQCVGCRRSVEKLFEEFIKTHHRAMEPLSTSCSETISIMPEYLSDPAAIYSLFYVQSSCLSMELNIKQRKGKRCVLHSIDAHKSKALWSWQDAWDLASSDCKEEIMLVDCDSLHVTLDDYLRKHRFCADCKNKVTYAYRILTREVDGASDKGFCPSLYEGIKVCDKERHLHVSCDEKFIKSLIDRAEPELAGNQREQHAKTIDVAQEEVLTCLGIFLHDRFFRLLQKLKVEEKSWIILYSLSVNMLRKNIENAFEKKLGDYNVDDIMHELASESERQKQPRRKKKKCKKIEVENMSPSCSESNASKETCITAEKSQLKLGACTEAGINNQDTNHNIVLSSTCQCATNVCHRALPSAPNQTSPRCTERHSSRCSHGSMAVAHGDIGADARVCNSCSSQSSTHFVSEPCSNAFNHVSCVLDTRNCNCCQLGISCIQCHRLNAHTFSGHSAANGKFDGHVAGDVTRNGFAEQSGCNGLSRYAKTLSLQEMLKAPCSSDDEDGFKIDEEDILRFKADEQRVITERQRLRQTLRQRFANMQERCICPKSRDYATTCNINVVTSQFAKISTE